MKATIVIVIILGLFIAGALLFKDPSSPASSHKPQAPTKNPNLIQKLELTLSQSKKNANEDASMTNHTALPIRRPDKTQTETEAFLQEKNDNIAIDEYGNFVTNLSEPQKSSYNYLISASPTKYLSQNEAANNTVGCAFNGYHIEYAVEFTVLKVSETKQTMLHYRCEFDSATQKFVQVETSPSVPMMLSVNRAMQEINDQKLLTDPH